MTATQLKSLQNSDKKHFQCQAPGFMFKAKKSLGKQDSAIYKGNYYHFLINYTLLGQWGNDADKISEMFLFYLKGKGSGFLVDRHPSQQDIQ